MKVALLGWHPLHDNRIIGGPEAVIVHLAQGLLRQGDVEVHVVILHSGQDTTVQRDGLTVHAVRARGVPRWLLLRADARAVRSAVEAIAPDVVHAHGSGLFADAALSSGRPALLTLHGIIWREAQVARQQGIDWRRRLSWAYDEWYERWNLRRAQTVVAISPYVGAAYGHRGRGLLDVPGRAAGPAGVSQAGADSPSGQDEGQAWYLIENPVGDAYFDLPRETSAQLDGSRELTILCAARVMPRKNTLTLLEAFALLRNRLPSARLRIAGETDSYPAYAARCRQAVRDHGLQDAVEFLGWLDEPAVQREYGCCSCLALVSWQETAPIAIQQAMAAGVPTVASDVGGVSYLLARPGQQAGLLVHPEDPAGIAEALYQVLSGQSLRAHLSSNGRAEASRRFRADAVAAQTRALYELVLASKRPRSAVTAAGLRALSTGKRLQEED